MSTQVARLFGIVIMISTQFIQILNFRKALRFSRFKFYFQPLSSSTFSGNDVANSGIRILFEDDNILFLFKTSNVAISSSNQPLHRAASIPVHTWCQNHFCGNGSFEVLAPWIDSFTSGIVAVKKCEAIENVSTYLIDKDFDCLYAVVECVVEADENIAIQYLPSTLLSKLRELTDRNDCFVEVLEGVPSRTHKYLSRVVVTLPCFNPSSFNDDVQLKSNHALQPIISQSQLLHVLSVCNAKCVSSGTASIFCALRGYKHSSHTPRTICAPALPLLPSPLKFLKLLKREKLFAEREQAMASQISSGGIDQVELCSHSGILLKYRSEALRPRPSSDIIIFTAVEHLSKAIETRHRAADSLTLSVCDLGVSSGAILLPILANVSKRVADLQAHQVTLRGLGIDIDDQSLELARENVMRNRALFRGNVFVSSPLQNVHRVGEQALTSDEETMLMNISFVNANFSHLDKLQGTSVGEHDVIVSNPPYLATSKSQGRVTAEAYSALVAGESGLELYESIMAAIVRSENTSRRLLRPTGVLIFQLPGAGQRAVARLKQIATSRVYGFTIVECVRDHRGVERGLVLSRSKLTIAGAAKTD